MKPTIGCLTRVYLGEIPYIRSFLDHGIRIGVDVFYLVFPSTNGLSEIDNALGDFRHVCEFIVESKGRNPNKALQIDIERIRTDYLISIDVDEFIYPAPKGNLCDLLRERNAAAYAMKWTMAPRDFKTPIGQITGFEGHIGKKLAQTKLVQGIEGPHNFLFREKPEFIRDANLKLVHYWGRSFNDIVIKCIYQALPGRKRSSLKEMEELLKKKRLPERLRVLASLTLHDHDTTVDHEHHQLGEDELEDELLAVASTDFLQELKGLYHEYKRSLDYERHVSVYPALGTIYDLGRTLPK